MRHLIWILLLPLLALADAGPIGEMQSFVRFNLAAGTPLRLGGNGDSWLHGDTWNGRVASLNAPVSRPYSWDSATADPTSTGGPVFMEQIGLRFNTPLWVSNAVGSMEFIVGSTLAPTEEVELRRSIWGMLSRQQALHDQPDILILPGGGGFNDMFSGQSYAIVREQAILTAARAIENYGDIADYIVWLAPRMVGLHHYNTATGTVEERQLDAAADFALINKYGTFAADTLRDELAARGYNVRNFITWDSRPYAVVEPTIEDQMAYLGITGPEDTAGLARIADLRWSDPSWYQDLVHFNDLGNKSYADAICEHLFGIDLSDTDTYVKGSGRTIYCDLQNGHNWLNRMKCTDRATPLATLQAAVSHANPGDIIRVIGQGNQALMLWDTALPGWVSANDYETRITKRGLTIHLEPGAYFSGTYRTGGTNYTGDGTLGQGFIDPTHCTAGTGWDYLSHASASVFYPLAPVIDLDLTIEGEPGGGNWISGYQSPLTYYGYNGITLRNLNITGGAGSTSIYARNTGGTVMDLFLEGCTVYADSGTVSSGKGQILLNSWNGTAALPLSETVRFDGHIKDCHFIGRTTAPAVTDSHIAGPIYGIDLINCQFEDPDMGSRWIDTGTTVTVPTGQFEPIRMVNCSWRTTDNPATMAALYSTSSIEDTLYAINCDFYAPNVTTARIISAAGQGTGGMQVVIGSAFVVADIGGTASDLDPNEGAITGGYSIKSYNTKSLALDSDIMRFGGVTSWLGYELSDFGIEHGERHASIGPTQYTATPVVVLGTTAKAATPAYAARNIYTAAQLTNAGLWLCDSLNTETWIPVEAPETPAEQAQAALVRQMYQDMPLATRQKLKLNFLN